MKLSLVGQLSNKVVYRYKYTPVAGRIMTKILFMYFRVCDFMKNYLKKDDNVAIIVYKDGRQQRRAFWGGCAL